jgi:hypothetical protein
MQTRRSRCCSTRGVSCRSQLSQLGSQPWDLPSQPLLRKSSLHPMPSTPASPRWCEAVTRQAQALKQHNVMRTQQVPRSGSTS